MIEEPTLRALIVYYGWPMTPRYSDVRGAITELLRAVTASEDVPHVVRCGAVARSLLGAASTGDASAALEHGFASPDLRGLLKPLGGDPSHFQVDVGFEDDEGTSRFTARPVAAHELGDVAEAIELSARLLAEIREAGDDVLRSLSAAAS